MPVLDRLKDDGVLDSMPKFSTHEDLLLAMECLAFCMIHMRDHGYCPTCVWLSDDQYNAYVSLYPEGTTDPKFFGLPVKANKSA